MGWTRLRETHREWVRVEVKRAEGRGGPLCVPLLLLLLDLLCSALDCLCACLLLVPVLVRRYPMPTRSGFVFVHHHSSPLSLPISLFLLHSIPSYLFPLFFSFLSWFQGLTIRPVSKRTLYTALLSPSRSCCSSLFEVDRLSIYAAVLSPLPLLFLLFSIWCGLI